MRCCIAGDSRSYAAAASMKPVRPSTFAGVIMRSNAPRTISAVNDWSQCQPSQPVRCWPSISNSVKVSLLASLGALVERHQVRVLRIVDARHRRGLRVAEHAAQPQVRRFRVQRVAEQQDAVLDPGVEQRLARGRVERGFVVEVEADDLGAERAQRADDDAHAAFPLVVGFDSAMRSGIVGLCACAPPSTSMHCPLMKRDSSLARKSAV